MNIRIKNFIKSKLSELVDLFPEMEFVLSQSKYTGDYFVQVIPDEKYDSIDFIKEESKIISDFINIFPNVSLTFVRDVSYIDPETENNYIIKPILEQPGERFNLESLLNINGVNYILTDENISNWALAA